MNSRINFITKLLKTYWKPLFAVFVWGLSFAATKSLLSEIKPVTIIFLRQLFGITFLAIIALKQKQSFAIDRRSGRWVILLGVITSLHLWIQITGLSYTSVSNTGWIVGVTPVCMLILGFFFFKEKIAAQQIFGIIVSFFGLFLLVSKGDVSKVDLIQNKGDLLVIASSFTWAVYSIVSKKATLNYSPLMTTLYLFAIMALVTSPFTLNAHEIHAVFNLSYNGWIAILFLGILCSGAGYYFWAQMLNEMSASKAGAFLYIEPFVTFFSAAILTSESISLITFTSGIIIITGVVLVNRK
jgi:drug/metabolite transporter (DMT)-like permease